MSPAGFGAVFDRINQANPYEAAIPANVPQYQPEPQPAAQPNPSQGGGGAAYRTADGVALLLGLLASGGGGNTVPLIAGFLNSKNQFAKQKQMEEQVQQQREIERQRLMMDQAQRTFTNNLAATRQQDAKGYQDELNRIGAANLGLREAGQKIEQEKLGIDKAKADRQAAADRNAVISKAFELEGKSKKEYQDAVNAALTATKDSPLKARIQRLVELRQAYGKPVDTPQALNEIATMAAQTGGYSRNLASGRNLDARAKQINELTPAQKNKLNAQTQAISEGVKIDLINAQTRRDANSIARLRAGIEQLRASAYVRGVDSLVNYRDKTLPLAQRKANLAGLIQQRVALGQIGNGLMFQIQTAKALLDEANAALAKNPADENAKAAIAAQNGVIETLNGELETNKQAQRAMLDDFGVPPVELDAKGNPIDEYSRFLRTDYSNLDELTKMGKKVPGLNTATSGVGDQGEFSNPYENSGVSPGSGLIPYRPPAPPTGNKPKPKANPQPKLKKGGNRPQAGYDKQRFNVKIGG